MKMLKRFFAMVLVVAFVFCFSVNALASVWTFGTGGQGANAFAPRGYSIVYKDSDNTYYHEWLDSSYAHDGLSGKQRSAYLGTETDEIASLDTDDYEIVAIYAWFDKNPKGYAFSGNSNSYKDALVYSTTGGTPSTKLSTVTGVTIHDADRTMTDPNGYTNQWSIEITFSAAATPSGTCVFGFTRGLQANNGISLALLTADVGNQTGYIGYASGSDSSELGAYTAQANTLYQYIVPTSLTLLGTGYYNSVGYDTYSVTFVDFYHSILIT